MSQSPEELYKEMVIRRNEWDAARDEDDRVTAKHFANGTIGPGQPVQFKPVITDEGNQELKEVWDKSEKAEGAYKEARVKYLEALRNDRR